MKESNSSPGGWQNMALPMVLIATGLILLVGDCVGILSLDRIQNLWSVAVIAIGLVELISMDGKRETQPASPLEERKKGNHARQL
jgi:hypothetical protein